jgi:type VI secretion system protein ImpJ
MKHLSKVVWAEGMYLGPHHFQVQNRCLEDAIHFTASSLIYKGYGFAGLSLDADALRNGSLSLLHARGIFVDGIPFQMPEADPIPEPREFAELFPPTNDSLIAYLAIPALEENGLNCLLPEEPPNGAVRFTAEKSQVIDENTGREEKPVLLGKKNFELKLETEDRSRYHCLPMARILRDGGGHYVFDEKFLPPLIDVGASEPLLMLLRRLIEVMQEKIDVLASEIGVGSRFQQNYSPQEIATFWFLHAIHSTLPNLRHIFQTRRGHPDLLYQELSRIAGALCTFGADSHPKQLPVYSHDTPHDSFFPLDDHIIRHLEYVVPSNVVRIQLQKTADYFYAAEIKDSRCFGASRWIFGIAANLGEVDLINNTSRLVKICSEKFVPELVKRAMPGLKLTHQQSPPVSVKQKVEGQYFLLTKSGPCWETIMKSKRVGVYVPEEIPAPEIELQIILD